MTVQRMDHVGIVVDDLPAATEFFAGLGFELLGEMAVEGRPVDLIVGLAGVRTDAAMMQTPDGHGRLELIKFHSPSHGCRSAAQSSSAKWCATGTATGSATSAGRRASSSSWPRSSADCPRGSL